MKTDDILSKKESASLSGGVLKVFLKVLMRRKWEGGESFDEGFRIIEKRKGGFGYSFK